MLTLSILWAVLAVTITLFTTLKKTPERLPEDAGAPVGETGRALTLLAVIYGLALLAGFAYIGKFLLSLA